MKKIFSNLQSSFESNANPVIAKGMKKYMRDQFEYIGIKSPLRKELVRSALGNYKPDQSTELKEFIENCWDQEHREYKYAAMDVSARFIRKLDTSYIPFFENLIAKESWWDTVDGLAPHLIGSIILKNIKLRNEYCEKWIESDNFWYQRSAIILQLIFKQHTDFELMKKLILRRADSKEFFVRKASGWALRQYSKTNPNVVEQFIAHHKLNPLTAREGLKIIQKKQ